MKPVFRQPIGIGLASQPGERLDYCSGCGHGTALRLIAEVIDEMGQRENTVAVLGVGCSSTNSVIFNFDSYWMTHGRAPAGATSIKRLRPSLNVFTLQGDGDLAAIGTTEIVHAAGRGEKFTTFMLNNANYGETGGQLAPTTLQGQRTMSSALGRDPEIHGFPIRMTEMLATLDGVVFAARAAINTPPNIAKTKKMIEHAFRVQQEGAGFSFVEILTACPSGWRMSPVESMTWMEEVQTKTFPLGVVKDTAKESAGTGARGS